MKQVFQDARSAVITIAEVPVPKLLVGMCPRPITLAA